MKKVGLLGCTALFGLLLFSQQQILIEESLVVNIEVPVRVFKDSDFVDNLSIKDFEVYENGVRQKIEAVYFIKKDIIQRKDEKKKFSPQTERTFYLFFELTEYDPRINEAVEYFIQNVERFCIIDCSVVS